MLRAMKDVWLDGVMAWYLNVLYVCKTCVDSSDIFVDILQHDKYH